MKFEQTIVEGLRHTYRITIPAALVEEKVEAYLAAYGNDLKIPGFRPGKVPQSVIETRYGVRAREQAMAEAMQGANEKLVAEKNIKPAGEDSKIEIVSHGHGKDLVYVYEVEVLPQFEIQDFGKIKLEKLQATVEEEQIEKEIEILRKSYKKFDAPKKERPAQNKDIVTVQVTTKVGGKAIPDLDRKELRIELGEPFIFPEVVQALTGMKEGQEANIDHGMPEQFWERKLAGKKAETHIKVIKIEEPVVVKVNDAWAKDLGMDNLEALRQKVREQVEQNYTLLTQMLLKRRILDALAEEYTFEVPARLVDSEFKQIWKRLEDELAAAEARGDLSDDDADVSDDELKTEYTAIAERRVRLGLVISEIGRLNDIHLSEEEVRSAVIREAMRYKGEEREIIEYYRKHPKALDRLLAPALEDKVVGFIASNAKIKEKAVDLKTFKKAIRGVLPTAFGSDDETEEDNDSEKTDKPKKIAAKKGK
ncbi:MAG: trigger factor [Alphaproteobacteria bacterium]